MPVLVDIKSIKEPDRLAPQFQRIPLNPLPNHLTLNRDIAPKRAQLALDIQYPRNLPDGVFRILNQLKIARANPELLIIHIKSRRTAVHLLGYITGLALAPIKQILQDLNPRLIRLGDKRRECALCDPIQACRNRRLVLRDSQCLCTIDIFLNIEFGR